MNTRLHHNAISTRMVHPLVITLVLAAFLLAPEIVARAQFSTYTVNAVGDYTYGTCDAADCTLREAILAANAHANGTTPDEIHFNIPTGCDASSKLCTIVLYSNLPAVTDPVIIDGYTQPGSSINTLESGNNAKLLIRLSGYNYSNTISYGLHFVAGSSSVRGLIFYFFNEGGIYIQGSNAAGITVVGNHITDTAIGVKVENSPNVNIGGSLPGMRNIISNNLSGGISITGSEADGGIVQGNYIGTDPAGLLPLGGNGSAAISINGAPNALIGGLEPGSGNLISGNSNNGILIYGSSAVGATVQGNFIGADVTGTRHLGNRGIGVRIDNAPGAVIGGTASGARNIIAHNVDGSILITGSGATGNFVKGNYIGSDVTGTALIAPGDITISATGNMIGGTEPGAGNLVTGGIYIYGKEATGNSVQGNYIGTDVTGTAVLSRTDGSSGIWINGAPDNTIGGAAPGAGNLISGKGGDGIQIYNAPRTIVQGNYIGVDVTGKTRIGNGGDGITISSSSNSIIGGTTLGMRNIISGNGQHGISIENSSAVTVRGNYIGTDVTGINKIGNYFSGVDLLWISKDNIIGGTEPGAGNIIAGNEQSGVSIRGNDALGNRVQGNSIFGNQWIGIDLERDFVNNNDTGDSDTGSNNVQNFPVLSSFNTGTLSGTLNSTTNTTFRVEFFANTTCNPTGYGEGEKFLGGLDDVTTDSNGNATFSFPITPVNGKPYFTATATNTTTGDTSEFSPCFPEESFIFLPVVRR